MRIIGLLLFFIPLWSYTQDSSIIQSKFEKFSSTTGRMFKTETKEIGKVKDLNVSIIKITDIESGEFQKAITITQKGSLLSYRYGSLFIDLDEIEGVSKALNYYLGEIKKGKPQNDPSYSYVTKNDVEVSCSYFTFLGGAWYVSISKNYHYLKSTIAGSTVTVKNKDIDDLVEIISTAKSTDF